MDLKSSYILTKKFIALAISFYSSLATPHTTPDLEENYRVNKVLGTSEVLQDIPKVSPTGFNLSKPVASPTVKPTANKATLFSLTNQYRNNLGKPSISVRQDICDVVKNRVDQIKNDFSHQGFRELIDNGRLTQLGYTRIAENIWKGSSTNPQETIDSWDQSEGHRQNMQDDWTWGCGILDSGVAVFIYMK